MSEYRASECKTLKDITSKVVTNHVRNDIDLISFNFYVLYTYEYYVCMYLPIMYVSIVEKSILK